MDRFPNKFVCPNDRQLSLRAKLKTGWCVKTANVSDPEGGRGSDSSTQPLGEVEQQTIVDVIRRAEKLEVSEQQRVGRLVDRLENLRRSASGRGPNQCLLCGESFSILGPQRCRCQDCGRLACHRCCITKFGVTKTVRCNDETFLCMICAETREIWKKSGAWFFKSLPKYILPNETRFKKTRSMRMRRYRDDDSSSEDERKSTWSRFRLNSGTESTQDVPEESGSNSRQPSSHEIPLAKELEPLRNYMGSMNLTNHWDDVSDSGTLLDSLDHSRPVSIASRSLNDWHWSSDTRSAADDKLSPSTSSVKSTVEIVEQKAAPLGTIELSLNYDQIANILHCTVYRCKNLIPMDMAGLSDPFCKLDILPNRGAKGTTRLRTKTVHTTRDPEFNENLTFYDVTEEDLDMKVLHVIIMDDDCYGHDYMGEVRVILAKIRSQNTVYVVAPLEDLRTSEQRGPLPAVELNQWFDLELWSRGQILLSLCYSTKRRALLVIVKRCANLLPMDNNGFSDPFVKLQLRPDPYHRKHKTTVKWKNLNPVYNEEFAFETRPTELTSQSLYVTVYDKDYGKSNDYLGGLILGGSGSKGQRLKHWLDMIRYPDHRHDQWHNLTEDVLE